MLNQEMAGRPGHTNNRRVVVKKLIMFVCALAIAVTAAAAPGKVKAKYSGVVGKYDAASKTLTVKQKDKEGVFVINDQSEITNGGAKADAAAFAAGKKVKIEFVMDGASKIAQKVEVAK